MGYAPSVFVTITHQEVKEKKKKKRKVLLKHLSLPLLTLELHGDPVKGRRGLPGTALLCNPCIRGRSSEPSTRPFLSAPVPLTCWSKKPLTIWGSVNRPLTLPQRPLSLTVLNLFLVNSVGPNAALMRLRSWVQYQCGLITNKSTVPASQLVLLNQASHLCICPGLVTQGMW